MSIDEIESVILRLGAGDRARLAAKLLESLDQLSAEENERLWAAEALRRDEEMGHDQTAARPHADVIRDAFARLK
ncbi:MAG TPA: addiction module protein [Blastocatellia bacterium]|nr:addiction module protein [Blastocatellia bacterium]